MADVQLRGAFATLGLGPSATAGEVLFFSLEVFTLRGRTLDLIISALAPYFVS